MKLFTILFGIASAFSIISWILYLIFGQVTVRKLRKNPETKEAMGMEFVSGLDIINVAEALAIPKGIMRKLKNSPLSCLYADKDILIKHTNLFDRILGAVFFWIFVFAGSFLIILVLLNALGVFD